MSGINIARVVAGGLLAGVVLNIGDFLIHGVLLAGDMDLLRQRLNLNPVIFAGNTAMATWAIVDLLLGVLIVWTYAAIRPRFGPGPGTAIAAGLVSFAAVTLVTLGYTQMGIFATASFVKVTLLWAVNVIAASLAGGWAYKEGPA